MRYEILERAVERSLRKQLATALLVCVALVGGAGGVAAYAEIGGAVIGSGKIVAEGRAKHIQHPDGGIVSEILVGEGQEVRAGQVLFRLDGTRVEASVAVLRRQLDQLQAQEARLLAEQAGRGEIVFPPHIAAATDEPTRLLVEGQRALMAARAATRESRKAQLTRQIAQYDEQITAYRAQQDSIGESLALLDDQIEDFTALQEKKLILESQLSAIRRERASLLGSRAALAASIVEVQQAITQTELQRLQVDEEFLQALLTELDQKRTDIARLSEELVAAVDRSSRLEIRAPLAGQLHELMLHTIGGVVSSGQTLVSIVSTDEGLIVEARLAPNDVDQVSPGKTARVRLAGLDQRVTPELSAHVLDVSPDLSSDPQTGQSYYVARLDVSDDQFQTFKDVLRPGMPVEVFIETGMRSVLSYLVKPITDQVAHALREG